ncbi:MAG: hypothetical protein RIC55_28040 [Pirellulaceae bacterium]
MKTLWLYGALVVLTLVAASSAPAQYDPFIYGYSGMMGGGYHHASTLEEGIQRGAADVIRSKGAANLMNSEASINWEQGRKAYIENRQLWTQTYFEMRRMNKQYREAERGPRPSSEDLYRYAKERAPDRLSPTELDPLTASIAWPTVLRDESFADDRKKMEALFARRTTEEGAADPSIYTEIAQTGQQMEAKLKERIRDYPANIYLSGKKFLEGLMYESTLPPSS